MTLSRHGFDRTVEDVFDHPEDLATRLCSLQ
jgi:hypothetical protein